MGRWHNERTGGGHKINLVKEYLKDKRDSDVFIFLDGYDTFLTDRTDEIISRYMEFSQDIVFLPSGSADQTRGWRASCERKILTIRTPHFSILTQECT